MHKLKVGIIGCGAISDTHIKHILTYKHADLIVLYDSNIEKLVKKSEAYHIPYVETLDELLQMNLDIVHVLTPHDSHYKIAKTLILNHIHVLVEKPLTIKYQDAVDLVHLAHEHRVTLSVCMQHRTNKTTKKMLALSNHNSYGKVLAISGKVHWHRDMNYYLNDSWRGTLKQEGGGVLINQAIHTLDIMNLLGGEVSNVSGCIDQVKLKDIEVEDTAHLHITYKGGAIGLLDATNAYPKDMPVEIDVLYAKGRVKLIGHQLFDITDGSLNLIEEDQSMTGKKFYFGAGHEKLIHDLYDYLLFNIGNYVEAIDTIVNLEIIEKIYQAKQNENISIQRDYWKED